MVKQQVKMLILSDTTDFPSREIIEQLNKYKRRHFDFVFILGDAETVVIREAAALFETALVAMLPKEKFPKSICNELGTINYNLQNMKVGECIRVLGYGSQFYNPTEVPIDRYEKYQANMLVSYHGLNRIHERKDVRPDYNREEINRYAGLRNPQFVIHGERKMNGETELSNGTKIIGCYGVCPIIFDFAVDLITHDVVGLGYKRG